MIHRLDPQRLKKIRLIFEDDGLLVVDKPAGLAVHSGADTKGRDLLTILKSALIESGERSAPPLVLGHRLDRGTSGVVLLAKDPKVAAILQSLWPGAKKRYLAIVSGHLAQSRRIDTPLPSKDGR
ncbi:MAG: pseudouridine synthase, partial [Myxococcota bacterium]